MFVSFLRSFNCRVINSVDGQGPLGPWSPTQWATLAHRCGIDTRPDGVTTGTRLLAQRVMSPPDSQPDPNSSSHTDTLAR